MYGSSRSPWRSLLKTWPHASHPHPAQATHLLGHKTNNVLQPWLAFLLHSIWANLSPSHVEQLAPSRLTCFLRTFWGLQQFSTNTALSCLCPEVCRSASLWGWGGWSHCSTQDTYGSCLWFGWEPCARGKQSKMSWRCSPPWQHQLPSPDRADKRSH